MTPVLWIAAERLQALEDEEGEERSTRKNRGMRAPITLPELPVPRKPKKQLTPEEMEERKKRVCL
jgi:hypothetical protein